MSERALLSLDEQLRSLSTTLEGQKPATSDPWDRNAVEADLVWCRVERGELGEAFRLLWEAPSSPDLGSARQWVRAELQAYCGNEDAALALIADLEDANAASAMVRARVARSRGDWELTCRNALEATHAPNGVARALILAARASIQLGRHEEATLLLNRVTQDTVVEALAVAALRACLSADDSIRALNRVAERAREEGAAGLCAEAWADASTLYGSRGESEEMRKAAVRAVELWDDMATSLPPPLRAGFWRDSHRRAIRKTSKRQKTAAGVPATTALTPLLANLRRLASERDLTKLLSAITDGAVALSGAERGFVLLVDESGALEAKTIRGAQSELGEQSAAFSRSIAETVLIDGDPVVTVDAAHDARVQDYMSVHQLMLKSIACLPIESRGRIWGVLYLEHRSASGRFSGTDLSLLRAYADQAAIAIETSHLFERVEAQKQELERANQALREANEHLEQRLHGKTAALQRTQREIAHLQASSAEGKRWGLVGASDGMRRVYEVLDRVAINEVPVVITGESGTGKELVARAVHRGSARADGPYISLNCGAIPDTLLESELFGHVAGAFTGATHAREGVFQQAHGGTLFLDEIADMPPRMQLDLLRVLQERCVRPVGGADEQPVDVRLVTSCKRPLRDLIEEGTLREDLYYRLAVVELELPPLRDRRSDIPLLCAHFLGRIAKERAEPKKRLSRPAIQRLGAHDFPGNVRELEHLLVNASVFAAGDTIEAEELAIEAGRTAPIPRAEVGNYQDFKDAERDRILETLNTHDWNRAKAARALGMARRTFYRRLKEHDIELPQGKAHKD
ncbi:MAG: sigma-54-dependent Fis family transcriptional regulator [Deltaproteobacteria bacterium]|nr:sigma-54-dependent Fis family transcriptional regulator [Deltaproteobacteria bacterium]MBW2550105.1 sigma-54-dependent Fis family transcriptional regulator [Deltaproteobacteria bacterium]